MFKKSVASGSGTIPDRPDRPLVVKCGYDGTVRRVNFPSATTCRLESLRSRVEECFSLSASPFFLTYLDDDGEEFSIRSERDLTDAIAYFISGDDDQAHSIYSGHSTSVPNPRPSGPSTISLRLEVVVEYDGPSLSDTSSILSFRTGSGTFDDGQSISESGESGWRSSQYTTSLTLGSTESDASVGGRGGDLPLDVASLSLSRPPSTYRQETPRRSSVRSNGSVRSARPSRQDSGHTELPVRPLTGPESAAAPSLLTHSELGSRWLREQSSLATRRLPLGPSSRRYDSDEDSAASDEESLGDLALVRDARGKFYYSYQTADTASFISTEPEEYVQVHRPSSRASTIQTVSPPRTPTDINHSPSSGPPVLASDCSACGIRLDYMRYVCTTCGESDKWRENAPGKAPFLPAQNASASSISSEDTDNTASNGSHGSQTIYGAELRSRSSSMCTDTSALSGLASYAEDEMDRPQRSGSLPRGYELCPGCVEVHGISHAKAAAKDAKKKGRRVSELRHAFREKIWGPEGWVDVDYDDDAHCTICHALLYSNRYKCVSCSKFDLCRSCFQKVQEIHPAHTFLSLPDRFIPAPPENSAINGRIREVALAAERPIRHPGAFCHNCLQDIVGPRFHCAVCPSWDLCIQCEGLMMAGIGEGSGHTAEHIMMKIPLPLANNEVEAVSRRARDRWYQQDSNTVAAASTHPDSSRSSSPTNETVYAGGTQHSGSSPVPPPRIDTARDALDHQIRCNNCNEWIMGKRYQCANCPSDPVAYNLCTICELRSYRVHDPRHVFFKFDRPVHIPLTSTQAILPLLYRSRVGEIPSGAIINPRDPVAYLKHVLHKETLCDIHSDQIRGCWLRCAHCAAGFDICQEAESIADHDPTHVFVVFKARVDMGLFRQLADLAAVRSRPLLHQQVYLS